MHADRDWQAVEGVLSNDMETVGEYLHQWRRSTICAAPGPSRKYLRGAGSGVIFITSSCSVNHGMIFNF